MNLPEDLPQIVADENQITEVILNILTNAEQAIGDAQESGRITIGAATLGEKLRLTISDDGPGIPLERLDMIFDPFFTTKEIGAGTGLGLSICHGIVRQHGGELWAGGAPGEGATFTMELPIWYPEGQKDHHHAE